VSVEGYEAPTYGDRVAGAYDRLYPGLSRDEPMVQMLHDLAGPGPALELGIGTGRVAIPLSRLGVEVHGVDASQAMVSKLRDKPGGDQLQVTLGDFARVPVEGRYRLVFVVFNTFFSLLTQDEQSGCFAAVADHLTDDGQLLIEAFVPDLARFDRNQRTSTNHIGLDDVMIDVALHDPVNQRVRSQHVVVAASGIQLYPVEIRYAWPSELDLMARLAGLRLCGRWADWEGAAFDGTSEKHISVYGR
jgi:SAM-dependent methyltransferase